MWICLNDAYFSIVNDPKNPDNLLVRARRPGDIERIFPDHQAATLPRRDYQFRASISRKEVASSIAVCLLTIDYGNFKGSVKDHKLHDAYASVWNVMARLQPQRPYSDYANAEPPKATPARRTKKQPDFFGGNVEYPKGV